MKNGLTPRQWSLKRFLEDCFAPNRYFTIEEICDNVTLPNGEKAYTLNTNPFSHDKCVALSNDIRDINWNICEGYKIIIKDSKGSAKLCESEVEFNEWKDKQMKPIVRKYQYLSNLKWKVNRDGTILLINNANNINVNSDEVSVFMK